MIMGITGNSDKYKTGFSHAISKLEEPVIRKKIYFINLIIKMLETLIPEISVWKES